MKLLEVMIFLECKDYTTHTNSFGGVGIRSWAGFGADGKISGEEAVTFPNFKIIIHNDISKTVL